ncbi:MAG: hypothetical protein ABIJ34_08365 [archaeon]
MNKMIFQDRSLIAIWFDIKSFYAQCELNANHRYQKMEEEDEKYIIVANTNGYGHLDSISIKAKEKTGINRNVRLTQARKDPRFLIVETNRQAYEKERWRLLNNLMWIREEGFYLKPEFIDDFSVHLKGSIDDALELSDRISRIYAEENYILNYGIGINRKYAWIACRDSKSGGAGTIRWDNYKMIWDRGIQTFPELAETQDKRRLKGATRAQKLNEIEIYTIGDIANSTPEIMKSRLGLLGERIWYEVQGYHIFPGKSDISRPKQMVMKF